MLVLKNCCIFRNNSRGINCLLFFFTLYRDLPRALMIGIPLVTIVYLLTNIAYIAVVGGERILTSGAVAMVSESVTKRTCVC